MVVILLEINIIIFQIIILSINNKILNAIIWTIFSISKYLLEYFFQNNEMYVKYKI